MKIRLLAVALLATATVALSGCAAAQSTSSTNSSKADTAELDIAVIGPLTSYDPDLADSGVAPWMLQPTYDQLIRYNVDGTFSPNLATSWKRPSPLTFDLTLRRGVTFHDGTPFNAAAVKANFDRIKSLNGPDASLFAKVASTTVLNDHEVELKLSSPDPSLELTLSKNTGMMASPTAIANKSLASGPVGTGPYTLDTANTLAGDHWTFVRSDSYWGSLKDFPYKKLVFKKYADANAILNAIRGGEVQVAYGDATTVAAAQSAGLQVVAKATNTVGLVISDRGGKLLAPLGDVRVRQALNDAVDRAAILKSVAFGNGTVTDQWFGPQTSGYDKSLEGTYSYNPTKAKKLLAAAGYPDGFEMAVTIPPIHEGLIQALQGYYAKIGVTVKINDSQANFFSDVQKGVTPAYTLQNAQLDLYSIAPNILLPGGLQNPFGTTDPKVQALYTKIGQEPAADAQKDWQAINKILTDDAWFVPLYNGKTIAYASPKVSVKLWPGMSTPWIYGFAPKS